MYCIGIDIIEIARIERVITRWKGSFLHRIYTELELKLFYSKPSSLAARFAGKEAVVKTIGTQDNGRVWRESEILAEPDGKPLVRLYGKAQNQADSLGLAKRTISFSHSKEYAVAFVVGETK